MLSISQLYNSTIEFNPKRRSTNISIINTKIGIFKSPTYKAKDTKSMIKRVVVFNFTAVAESDATPYGYWVKGAGKYAGPAGGRYRVFIFVPEVNLRLMKSNDAPLMIGPHRYMKPINLNIKPVKVRCDCHDFRWRFAYYDDLHHSLYGATPPPYTPVPGSTRGPVNPRHLPGVCKHIMATFNALNSTGYIG